MILKVIKPCHVVTFWYSTWLYDIEGHWSMTLKVIDPWQMVILWYATWLYDIEHHWTMKCASSLICYMDLWYWRSLNHDNWWLFDMLHGSIILKFIEPYHVVTLWYSTWPYDIEGHWSMTYGDSLIFYMALWYWRSLKYDMTCGSEHTFAFGTIIFVTSYNHKSSRFNTFCPWLMHDCTHHAW